MEFAYLVGQFSFFASCTTNTDDIVCYSLNEGQGTHQDACDYSLQGMGLNSGHSAAQRTLLGLGCDAVSMCQCSGM
jgi:hypothetical protein